MTSLLERLLVPVALSLTVAACGSAAPPRVISGRAVFAHECSGCHSLSGRENPRRQGGDLLSFRSPRNELVQLTREMPVRHPLSPGDLRAVVDYVSRVELSRRPSR